MKLRPWQQSALDKAYKWLIETATDKHFLINAAPGAGKTIAACVIARKLFDEGLIDRVVVIAPRVEVVKQWGRDFHLVTGRYMGQVTGKTDEIEVDVCATWAAIEGLRDGFQALCRSSRVMVVCDEHHHAAVAAAWGSSADGAFADAKYVLVLTGTPIRSDGREAVWLAYTDAGKIDHPADGTYTLGYGEAVDLEYCRPATFHRHEGRFTVDLNNGEQVQISSETADIPADIKRIAGLQRALDFYKLACTPQFEADNTTPKMEGYQGTMVAWATEKLDDLRLRMANAGGLVISPTIQMAEYMAKLIEHMEGEKPTIVHSQLANPETRIESFRHTDKRWIVSVGMISEGVDIPRLRILLYLPNALTELAFRQAVGRVVRTAGPEDDTRAYIVMPSLKTLEEFARRVEEEMSPQARADVPPPESKRCPICGTEADRAAKFCEACGHEYPTPTPRFKTCATCDAENPLSAKECQNCGQSFAHQFTLTLDEALRTGVYSRGIELDEEEVRHAEAMAAEARELILRSGEEKFVKIARQIPEELWGRLAAIFAESQKNVRDRDNDA